MRPLALGLSTAVALAALGCGDAPPAPRAYDDLTLPVVPADTATRGFAAVSAAIGRATSAPNPALAAVVATVAPLSPIGERFLSLNQASAINAGGQVVGSGPVLSGEILLGRGFLWDAATGATDLGTLGGETGGSGAAGVNNLGQVVGGSEGRVFLWDPAAGMRDLGGLQEFVLAALAVNDAEQVVGFWFGLADECFFRENEPDCFRPFLWEAATGMVDLRARGLSSAVSINDAGQIAGRRLGFRAVILEPRGGLTELGTLGGETSTPSDINEAGQVVGFSDPDVDSSEGSHAFLWDRSTGMVDLGVLPGDLSSRATAINNVGQVVGVGAGSGFFRPFLWQGGSGMVELPLLAGDTEGQALDVNDAGTIVGWSAGPSGPRAVRWTVRTTPEGAPVVDRLLAVVRPAGHPSGMGGVALRVRLTDADDTEGWTWHLDWSDGVVHTPTVDLKGEFVFLRRQPYEDPGTYTITVSATDAGGATSGPVTTTVTAP
jgi:probable HAF family extracellular repeat protein